MTSHAKPPVEISVVVPAYNESLRIGSSLDQMLSQLRGGSRSFEVIVVDDGSSDATAERVRGRSDPEVVVLQSDSNHGKGASVRKGVARSRGGRVLLADADYAISFDYLRRFMELVDRGADVVCASKALPESKALSTQPFHRRPLGRLFNIWVRTLGLSSLKDTQCGFKLFRGDVARELFSLSRVNGFVFDVEIVFLARRSGYLIKEEPVQWKHVPMSHVRAMSSGLSMFRELVRLRVDAWLGRYRLLNTVRRGTAR